MTRAPPLGPRLQGGHPGLHRGPSASRPSPGPRCAGPSTLADPATTWGQPGFSDTNTKLGWGYQVLPSVHHTNQPRNWHHPPEGLLAGRNPVLPAQSLPRDEVCCRVWGDNPIIIARVRRLGCWLPYDPETRLASWEASCCGSNLGQVLVERFPGPPR